MTNAPARFRRLSVAAVLTLLVAHSATAQNTPPPISPQSIPGNVAAAVSAPEYGTTAVTYVQVAGSAFVPLVSPSSYTTTASGHILRTAGGAGGSLVYFAAPINIPSGALVKSLELDECDPTGVAGYVQGSLIESDRLGNIIASAPYLESDGLGCKTLTADLTSLNMVADNHTKHFWLEALVGVADNVGLAGMVVGYQLQVSPAPATATFLDVPTSNLFFQYVEALAASGITGGCGSGNFCPNNPVTRGQMAVFLAKALGLQFQ